MGHVIVLNGINDIVSARCRRRVGAARADERDAEQITEGLQQLIARSRARGVRCCGHAGAVQGLGLLKRTERGEAASRQPLDPEPPRMWIVVDFDAALRDAGDPLMLNPLSTEATACTER